MLFIQLIFKHHTTHSNQNNIIIKRKKSILQKYDFRTFSDIFSFSLVRARKPVLPNNYTSVSTIRLLRRLKNYLGTLNLFLKKIRL